MYNQPFFIPQYITPTRGGFLGRLLPSFRGLRSINWGGLINNTSKTLNLINQSIPIVKQVGPMVGNMKSMLKVASAFNDVTNTNSNKNNISNTNNSETYNQTTNNNIKNIEENYSPTFFVNS